MRITIIGTSNSIMKIGWTRIAKALWASEDADVSNLSIGGSSARYAAFVLHDQPDLWSSDRIIIDSTINDQMFINAHIASIDHAVASYAAILQRARSHGALDRLLILMFPMQTTEAGCCSDVLINRLVAMFDFYGVDHIDMRPHLATWATLRNEGVADTHGDANHIKPHYQDRIGALVAWHPVGPRVLTRAQVAARAGLDGMTDIRLRRLKVSAAYPTRSKTVGTSLQEQTVQCFGVGQTFRIGGAEHLVGALIWTHAQSGGLIIRQPPNARRLNLRRIYDSILLFDTMFRVVKLAPSTFVRVGNDADIPPLKGLGLHDPNVQIEDATVEFAALVGADVDPVCLAAEVTAAMEGVSDVAALQG
jgi:hypothetical protein